MEKYSLISIILLHNIRWEKVNVMMIKLENVVDREFDDRKKLEVSGKRSTYVKS